MYRLLRWVLVVCLAVSTLPGFGQSGNEAGGTRRVRVSVKPEYPEIARKMSIRGVVQLWVKVTGEGTVKEVGVVGGNPVLAEAAMTAVKKWRYEATGKDSMEPVKFTFN
jgi:TonB family protein